jgi:hypothetical protein
VREPTEPDETRQPLSPAQEAALPLVLSGRTDGEVAEAVGVARQTVNGWRLHHPAFIAELNARRVELWRAQTERFRGLAARAVAVLEEDLAATEPSPLRQAAAVHVLRALSLYGVDLEPGGPTTPEAVKESVRFDEEMHREAAAALRL